MTTAKRRSSPIVLRRLSRQGFEVRGAIASTAGAAWALSHYGAGGIVPAGGEAEAIAELAGRGASHRRRSRRRCSTASA